MSEEACIKFYSNRYGRRQDAFIVYETDNGRVVWMNASARRAIAIPTRSKNSYFMHDFVVEYGPSPLSLGHVDGNFRGEWLLRDYSGKMFASTVEIRTQDAPNCQYAIAHLTSCRSTQNPAEWLKTHDQVTGLVNRIGLAAAYSQMISKMNGHNHGFMAVAIDIDRMGYLNDLYGVDFGDRIIQSVGARLSLIPAAYDNSILSRLGNDEFLILTPGKANGLQALCDEIHASTESPLVLEGKHVHISLSLGAMHVTSTSSATLNQVLKHGAAALLVAKGHGGGSSYIQEGIGLIPSQGISDTQIASILEHSIGNADIGLVLQPRVDIRDGSIVSAEVLARWITSAGLSIPPGRFVPIAERIGLVQMLGDHMLAMACREIGTGSYPNGFRLAVNVSPREINRGDFVRRLRSICDGHGVAYTNIEVELTENALLHNTDVVKAQLKELKRLGVHLSLDDFGQGYSTFTVLKSFGFDCIKIDRNYVEGLPVDKNDIAIVEAIMGVARKLNIQVIAEGVSNEAQLACLKDHGVTIVQGYLLGKPVSPTELAVRIESTSA